MKPLYFTPFALLFMACNNYMTIEQESPLKNTVESGKNFRVILPENHTTGYIWILSPSFDTEKIDYQNAVWHGNEKGVYYNFAALEKGTTTLNFTLIKHQDTSAIKSFIVEIK